MAEALSLFDRIEVGTLEILDQSKLEDILIRDIADDCRNLLEPRKLRRLIASLPCHNLVGAACLAYKNRLQHAMLLDGISKLLELLLIELLAGLVGIRLDLGDWQRCISLCGTYFSVGLSHEAFDATAQSFPSHDVSPPWQASYMQESPCSHANTS